MHLPIVNSHESHSHIYVHFGSLTNSENTKLMFRSLLDQFPQLNYF